MLKDYVVLYINHNTPLVLETFLCQAEDIDHAEEQCLDAYPNADAVWIEEGTE
jgi:hypothetical protein